MKILHFAYGFIPIYGGTTTRLLNLLSDIRNKHYLYVPFPSSGSLPNNIGKLENHDVFGNIYVRRCNLIDNSKFKNLLATGFISMEVNPRIFIKSVKEKDFQIVHGHNPLGCAIAAMKYSKKNNLPFVYEAHDILADRPLNQKEGKSFKEISQPRMNPIILKEKRVFGAANAIITQTNAMKRRIINIYDIDTNKVHIIPNGIDGERFNPEQWNAQSNELKKKKNWIGKVIFMYIGFLDNINGVSFFLDAVNELQENIKCKIKIVIVGRGPLQNYVETMSKNKESLIEYLGVVNYEEMPIYYSACDVFVIPRPSSLPAETLTPVKLLEAMAMEKLVLGSDAGGLLEVLKNNENGIIFKKGNKEDLLKKIIFLVKNIETMDHIMKQARKDAIQNFSWQRSRKLLQDVYNSVV